MPDTPRDQAFLDFRAGPSRATLTRLLEAEQHNVLNVCFHVLRHREEAEDAAQDVLLKAVDAASTVADAQHWRRWLTRASVNAALDAARGQKRRSGLAERRAAMEAARVPAADDGEALGAALAGLEDDERSLVVGHFLEKVSLENLGRERGVSGQAIWKRLERAKERLREALTAAGCAAMVPGLENAAPVRAVRNLVSGPVAAKISAAFGVAAATAAGGVIVATKAWTVAAIAAVLLAGVLGVGIPRYRDVSGRARRAAALEERLAEESRARSAAESEIARLRAAAGASTASATSAEAAVAGTNPVVPAPKASLGERLDALVAWMKDLRTEMESSSKHMTRDEATDELKQKIAARSTEFFALRQEVTADPSAILERLSGPNAGGDLFVLYLLLGGDLEAPDESGSRARIAADKLPPALVDGLFEITRTGAPEARAAALEFLGRFPKHPESWDERFLALLKDDDLRVRCAALHPLDMRNAAIPAEYLEPLQKIAESGDPEMRWDGIRAISLIQTKEAREYLFSRLASEKDASAVTALADSIRVSAMTLETEERPRLIESMRAALPRAVTTESCSAMAWLALQLPIPEAREFVVVLARSCPDEELRGRLDRILAAIEGGEDMGVRLRSILSGKE